MGVIPSALLSAEISTNFDKQIIHSGCTKWIYNRKESLDDFIREHNTTNIENRSIGHSQGHVLTNATTTLTRNGFGMKLRNVAYAPAIATGSVLTSQTWKYVFVIRPKDMRLIANNSVLNCFLNLAMRK